MANKYNTKEREREFLIECIELYRRLPALWQLKSKLYHNREKKNMAYDVLLAKYRKMYPQATKDDLKRRINSLRTNYRKELKKHLESARAGDASVYQPSLWYFEQMSFLRSQEAAMHSESALDASGNTIAVEDGDNEEITLEFDDELSDEDEPKPKKPTLTYYIPSESRRRDELAESHVPTTSDSTTAVETEAYGRAIGLQLQQLDGFQRTVAQKIISDAIFYGRLNKLSANSHINLDTDKYN